MMKTIAGGMLVQSRDNGRVADADLKVVTRRAPTAQELADCRFAWTVAKHVKSNAIVYAKGGSTAGVGAGQMNRLESARIAAWKAKDAAEKAGWPEARTIGSAVASDAFFPFADGLLRSEEHTSELQSLMRISYAVFCLKKKKTTLSNHESRIPHDYVNHI